MQITITLNKILAKNPCRDGLMRLLSMRGMPKDYVGDDVEFPMSDILNSNIIDDAIWAMRCIPEHAQLWRKFAIWCGIDENKIKVEQKNAAYIAFWSAKYACGKIENANIMLIEKERQAKKLREILDLGEWRD